MESFKPAHWSHQLCVFKPWYKRTKSKGKKKKTTFHPMVMKKGLIQGFFTKVNDVHGPPEFIWNILFELPIFPLAFIETLRALRVMLNNKTAQQQPSVDCLPFFLEGDRSHVRRERLPVSEGL